MKKIFKIAFAGLLAFSIAPALAIAFNQSKEVTSVQAEETVVTADQVKYQDGDTVKTFEDLPTGYTFENGVLTVTSSSTKDYSIWVEDATAGNLTIVFERDYGGNSLGVHGESSIYFEYQGKKKLTLTSIDSVDVTLGALYTDAYASFAELEISGKVNLKIVGGTTEKFQTYEYLVCAKTFNLLDDASVYSIDPYWPNSNNCSIIYIWRTVNINTTGYVIVGFEDRNAYAIEFGMTKEYFNLIRCDEEMMLYCKIWDFDDTSTRRDYKTAFDLDFNEYIYHQEYQVGAISDPTKTCSRTRIKPYIVSYNPNGGTGEMDFYGGRIGTIQLPTCTFTPPAGKQFKCWKLQGYSIECQPGDDFEIMHNRDATFNAIWEDAPNPLTGTVNITGSLKYDETLTATVTDTNNSGTLSYQWRRNGSDIASATSSTYVVTEDDIGCTLSVVVTSSVETGSIVGTASGVITKADGLNAPTGITAVDCTTEANNNGVLNGVTTDMEYKLSSDSVWTPITGTSLTGLLAGTYNIRYQETNTHEAGETANVVVNEYNAPVQYSVTVNGGTANPVSATEGTTITITANAPEEGKVFSGWTSDDGVAFADASALTTTFVMPTKNVTVTANYEDEVIPTVLQSITLSGTHKTSFEVGDTFSYEGLIVTAHYNNKADTIIANGYNVSSPDMSTEGSKTVTVSYTEEGVTKTATYQITVTAKETPVTPSKNSGLPAGAIVGIVIGSVLVVGIGGFALVWFVIKKKTWADFVALFKKK